MCIFLQRLGQLCFFGARVLKIYLGDLKVYIFYGLFINRTNHLPPHVGKIIHSAEMINVQLGILEATMLLSQNFQTGLG